MTYIPISIILSLVGILIFQFTNIDKLFLVTIIIVALVSLVVKVAFMVAVSKFNNNKIKLYKEYGMDLMYFDIKYFNTFIMNDYNKNLIIKRLILKSGKLLVLFKKILIMESGIIVKEDKKPTKIFMYNEIEKLSYDRVGDSLIISKKDGRKEVVNDLFKYYSVDIQDLKKYILMVFKVYEIDNDDQCSDVIRVFKNLLLNEENIVFDDFLK